jgi:hypothetical protein
MLTGITARQNVTDRALRYRAQQNAPEGERRCVYCGSPDAIDVEHIDGREENCEPENLTYACRSCNTKKGVAMRNAGLGRRTVQFNPQAGARSVGQWIIAVMSAKGDSNQMSVADAVEMIRATSQHRRTEFAKEIWARRREHGTDRSEVPF